MNIRNLYTSQFVLIGILSLGIVASLFSFPQQAKAIGCDTSNEIFSFSGSPSPAARNSTVTLSWSVDASCDTWLDLNGGLSTPNWVDVSDGSTGSYNLTILPPSTYTIAVFDGGSPLLGDTPVDTATINIPVLPSVTLTASPTSLSSGNSSTLSWTAFDATSCTASGDWSGSKATSGSQSTGSLTATQTYTITCVGTGGTSAPSSATVTVNSSAPPTVDIKAKDAFNTDQDGPLDIAIGNSTAVTWTSTGATSCTGSMGTASWPGSKATFGAQGTGAINSTISFRIDCTGPGGTSFDTVTLVPQAYVGSAQAVCVGTPPATPQISLSWTSGGYNRFHLHRGPSSSASGSNLIQIINNSTSYTDTSIPNGYGALHQYSVLYTNSSDQWGGESVDMSAVATCDATITVSINGNPSQTPTWSISPESKSGTGNGSVTVRPSSNSSIYTITPQTLSGCSFSVNNTDGSGASLAMSPGNSKSFAVTYTCGSGPTVTLTASPTSVSSGNSSTLTWTVSNSATSCTASNGWSGAKSTAGGSQSTGALTTTTTYDIICTNASGSDSDSATVTVTGAPPATPTNLTATPGSCGTGAISLSWNSSATATSYELYRNGVQIYTGASTSYTDSGLTAGNSYTYTVRATNSFGSSSQSSGVSATAPTSSCTPGTPTGLTATPSSCGTGTIGLSWSSVSGATSYQLYRNGAQVYSGSATSFNDTGLTASNVYSYTVRATNSAGSSSQSGSVNGTAPATCSVPSVPTGLTATPGACTTGTINVSWNSVSGATSYTLRDGATVIYSGSATSFSHTGLVAASSHSYTVLATNSSGSSAYSSASSASAPASTCSSAPTTPTGFTATAGACSSGNITLSWNAVSGATGYILERGGVQIYAGTALSYVDSGRTASTNYSYTVLAYNSFGNSPRASASAIAPAVCSTATITVNTNNAGATWGGSFSGSGLTQSYTVTPSSGGTLYTLTAGGVSGFSAVVTNSQGTGSSMTVLPGGSETFTITYSASGPVPTVSISASPASGTVNVVNPQLTWSATNSPTSCTASGDWSGAKATSGTNVSQGVLTSARTYTYTLTCTNASGTSVPTSDTVVVSNPTPFDYSLSAQSSSVSITKSSSDVYVQNVINGTLTSGTGQPVTLTATGMPSGVSISYSGQPCTPTCAGGVTIQFTVTPTAAAGTYPITVSGSPSGVSADTATFNLVINNPVGLSVVCTPNPTTSQVGQSVTWTANVSGGTGPFAYSWSGTDIPTAPAPSSNPYSISYATVGAKSGSVIVTDTSNGSTASCLAQSVQVNVKPVLIEF